MPEIRFKFDLSTPEPLFHMYLHCDTPEGDLHSAAVGMVDVLRDVDATAHQDAATILAEIEELPWADDDHSDFRDDAPISTYEKLISLVDKLESIARDIGLVVRWDSEWSMFYVATMELQPNEFGDDIVITNFGDHYRVDGDGPFYDLAAAVLHAEGKMERDGFYPNVWVDDGHGSYDLVVVDYLVIDGVYKVGTPDATVAGRNNGPRARCIECGRIFDLTDDKDAAEFAYGHDCEA